MSITNQVDTQLRVTNVAKLGMRRDPIGTTPALKLLLGVEVTHLGLHHNRTKLDVLRKLEDYRMMPKRRMKNIWSSNLERKLKLCIMVPA